jgi:hypothetical protein
LLCIVIVAAGSAVFGVASAGAAITETAITSPSSPFLYQYDVNASSPATVTITGTTNSTDPSTDTVDVRCYYSYDWGSRTYETIASNVALNPDGTFSTGPVSPDVDGVTCQLRAVPHNSDPTDLSGFGAVPSQLDFLENYSWSGSGAPYYDYYYTGTSTGASDYYDSVGSCGLDYALPINTSNGGYDDLSLNPGANTVTATASDGSGNSAQASETIVYAPNTPNQQKFCMVPNVRGKKLGKAKAALKTADCRVGKVHKVRSKRFRKGHVEHASHGTGVVLKAGTKVGLTESIGKPKKHKHHSKKGPMVPAHRSLFSR